MVWQNRTNTRTITATTPRANKTLTATSAVLPICTSMIVIVATAVDLRYQAIHFVLFYYVNMYSLLYGRYDEDKEWWKKFPKYIYRYNVSYYAYAMYSARNNYGFYKML